MRLGLKGSIWFTRNRLHKKCIDNNYDILHQTSTMSDELANFHVRNYLRHWIELQNHALEHNILKLRYQYVVAIELKNPRNAMQACLVIQKYDRCLTNFQYKTVILHNYEIRMLWRYTISGKEPHCVPSKSTGKAFKGCIIYSLLIAKEILKVNDPYDGRKINLLPPPPLLQLNEA